MWLSSQYEPQDKIERYKHLSLKVPNVEFNLYLLTFQRKVFDINALKSTYNLNFNVKFWHIRIYVENLTSNKSRL